jgi:hypothetical protein
VARMAPKVLQAYRVLRVSQVPLEQQVYEAPLVI